jgi:hypothetical protein
MDTGTKRTAKDAFHFAGYEFPKELATAARLVYLHEQQQLQTHSNVSIFDTMDTANRCGRELKEAIEFVRENGYRSTKNAVISVGLAAFCFYTFVRQNRPKAEEFMRGLGTGQELAQDDPRLLLRARFLKKDADRHMDKTTPYIFKTWVYYREGIRIKQLQGPTAKERWWDLQRPIPHILKPKGETAA